MGCAGCWDAIKGDCCNKWFGTAPAKFWGAATRAPVCWLYIPGTFCWCICDCICNWCCCCEIICCWAPIVCMGGSWCGRFPWAMLTTWGGSEWSWLGCDWMNWCWGWVCCVPGKLNCCDPCWDPCCCCCCIRICCCCCCEMIGIWLCCCCCDWIVCIGKDCCGGCCWRVLTIDGCPLSGVCCGCWVIFGCTLCCCGCRLDGCCTWVPFWLTTCGTTMHWVPAPLVVVDVPPGNWCICWGCWYINWIPLMASGTFWIGELMTSVGVLTTLPFWTELLVCTWPPGPATWRSILSWPWAGSSTPVEVFCSCTRLTLKREILRALGLTTSSTCLGTTDNVAVAD